MTAMTLPSAPSGQERNHFFIRSRGGGRLLSALQLPLFQIWPPQGYGVLTTTGAKTGKTRRRCVRAVRRGDRVYLVKIKDPGGWARNALTHPVRLRLRGGTISGRARELRDSAERDEARHAYCDSVFRFDRLTWRNWRKGRPTPEGIQRLLSGWFQDGTPLVIDLDT